MAFLTRKYPRRLMVVIALVAMSPIVRLHTTAAASVEGDSMRSSTMRVRPLDARARSLVDLGMSRSPAIRQLVEELELSDVIVYVETRLLGFAGQTTLVGASAEARFLRITLDVPGMEDRLLAVLGHELQHAVEIVRAPEVTTADALLRHYLRIGHVVGVNGVCTHEAQRMTAQVATELALESGH